MSMPSDLIPYVDAAAQMLRIPLDPAWREGVCFNMEVIVRFADLVEAFPLPDDAEPAPFFRA